MAQTLNDHKQVALTPWCVRETAIPERISKSILRDFFAKLRTCPDLSHRAIILPELGGVTAGEMALTYLRADMAIRKKRKLLKKQQQHQDQHSKKHKE